MKITIETPNLKKERLKKKRKKSFEKKKNQILSKFKANKEPIAMAIPIVGGIVNNIIKDSGKAGKVAWHNKAIRYLIHIKDLVMKSKIATFLKSKENRETIIDICKNIKKLK